MKLSNLLIFSVFCIGCNQSFMDKPVDNRPAAELALIKRVGSADSVCDAAINDIKKKEAIDNGKTTLAKFIRDTLHSEVKSWNATIYKMELSRFADSTIEVTLLIPNKGMELNEKVLTSNTITLFAKTSFSNLSVKNQLAAMQVNDKVLVSGSFEKDELGNIDVSTDDINDNYIFTSLKFNFNIENITKAK